MKENRKNIEFQNQTRRNVQKNLSFFQPKLSINTPGDVHEQEADAMADKVMRMKIPQKTDTFFKPAISTVQRKCAACAEEDKKVHRKENSGSEVNGSNELDNYVSSLSSSGQPLSESSRQFFEPRFGQDFSNVKVHTDSIAAKSAESINALAYTTGNNIVFNQGQYSPNSESGQRLMAHELTHVVQQNSNVNTKRIQRASINIDGIPDAKKDTVKKAVDASEQMANMAQMTMGGDNITLYNRWYDSSYDKDRTKNSAAVNARFDSVKKNWVKMYSVFKSRKIVLTDAEASKKDPSHYAYVYPHDGAYKIFLDNQFWTAKNAGQDSKPGTIIHELAHEEVYTQDVGYGDANARNFALTKPDDAVNNSDNWEYFAERV